MSVSNFVREYGGFIWTNHVLERIKQRGLTQADVLAVLKNPAKTFPGHKNGSVKFIRTLGGRRIHAVAVLNEDDKKWVVVSVWVRGEEDRLSWYETLVRKIVDLLAKALVGVWKKVSKF